MKKLICAECGSIFMASHADFNNICCENMTKVIVVDGVVVSSAKHAVAPIEDQSRVGVKRVIE